MAIRFMAIRDRLYQNYIMTSHPQPNNPLHGITLKTILTALVERYGRAGLAEQLPFNCFLTHPTVKSSLVFLRKELWAREKVEKLYLEMIHKVS